MSYNLLILRLASLLYTQHNKDEWHSSLEKYTYHFIWKGWVWEGVGDRTELQHIDPHPPTLLAITAFLSRSPGLLNWEPGGPASLGHVPQSGIFSPTLRISNCNCLIGAWGPLLLGGVFSTASFLQLVWLPVFTRVI